MLTCEETIISCRSSCEGGSVTSGRHQDVGQTYVKVWHAWLFKFVPESAGDDIDWDIMSDNSTDAGQGRLDKMEEQTSTILQY